MFDTNFFLLCLTCFSDKPNAVHPLHRTFLMEVYWLRKHIVDKTFSDVLETAKKTFTDHKGKPEWTRYILIILIIIYISIMLDDSYRFLSY
jgi:hypothetical protein